jgi:hypothetical protein
MKSRPSPLLLSSGAQKLKAFVSISNKRIERVFLVGVELKSRTHGHTHESLAGRATTAGNDVIARVTKH